MSVGVSIDGAPAGSLALKARIGLRSSRELGTATVRAREIMAAAVGTKMEVTKGVFDPRTYKELDKDNWARKRR